MELAGAEAVTAQALLAEDPAGRQREIRLDGGEHQDRSVPPPLFELAAIAARVAPKLVFGDDVDGRAETTRERVRVAFLDEQPAFAKRKTLVEARLHRHRPTS